MEEDTDSPGQEPTDIVATIDLGAAYSGYAFATNDDIIMNVEWPTRTGRPTLKTPSVCLTQSHSPDMFKAYGYDAYDIYTRTEEADKYSFYPLYQYFKCSPGQKNKNDDTAESKRVLTTHLRYFYKHLHDYISRRLKSAEKENIKIQWVFPLPDEFTKDKRDVFLEVANDVLTELKPSSSVDMKVSQTEVKTKDSEKSKETCPSGHITVSDKAKEESPSGHITVSDKAKEESPSGHITVSDKTKEESPSCHITVSDKAKEESPSSHITDSAKAKEESPSGHITVSDKAKEEIPSGHITVSDMSWLSEIDAAAIWCHHYMLEDTQDENTRTPQNTEFILINAGGCHIDIAVFKTKKSEIVKTCKTKPIYYNLDDLFEEMLKEAFGFDIITKYKKDYHKDWIYIFKEFEQVKHRYNFDNHEERKIDLPVTFYNYTNTWLRYLSGKNKWECKNGYLVIPEKKLDILFKPMRDIIPKIQKMPGEYIFVVGGFSNIIGKHIRANKDITTKTIVPMHADVSVIKGCILFGQGRFKVDNSNSKTIDDA